MKVIVLGVNGMLGSRVLEALSDQGYDLYGSTRNGRKLSDAIKINEYLSRLNYQPMSWYPGVSPASDLKADIIVNCIGVIKPNILRSESEAIYINSVLPHQLAELSNKGAKVIHITTDCVFSGESACPYFESSPHDAKDLYGKSKSLGECDRNLNIRTSIIGNEICTQLSLVEWVKNHPGPTINGFLNHFWNGMTTRTLGDCINKIIQSGFYTNVGTYHIYSDSVSKYSLVQSIVNAFKLPIEVEPVLAPESINRVLASHHTLVDELLIPPLAEQIKLLPTEYGANH